MKTAVDYARLISRIDGEDFLDTCARMSKALGEKVRGRDFFKAVRLVRKGVVV
jgi:hypothetical protein